MLSRLGGGPVPTISQSRARYLPGLCEGCRPWFMSAVSEVEEDGREGSRAVEGSKVMTSDVDGGLETDVPILRRLRGGFVC